MALGSNIKAIELNNILSLSQVASVFLKLVLKHSGKNRKVHVHF